MSLMNPSEIDTMNEKYTTVLICWITESSEISIKRIIESSVTRDEMVFHRGNIYNSH